MRHDRKTILVVDDSPELMGRIIFLLQGLNYVDVVLQSRSYEESLPLLDKNPDFIFLDINLPGKSGIELLRYIKQSPCHAKICMISNFADASFRKACSDLGADDFLDKSNDFDKIPGFIKRYTDVQ